MSDEWTAEEIAEAKASADAAAKKLHWGQTAEELLALIDYQEQLKERIAELESDNARLLREHGTKVELQARIAELEAAIRDAFEYGGVHGTAQQFLRKALEERQ